MKTQTHMFPPSSFHDTSHTLPSGKSVQTPVSQQLPPQFLFQQVMGEYKLEMTFPEVKLVNLTKIKYP